jgi:hypothetical protein
MWTVSALPSRAISLTAIALLISNPLVPAIIVVDGGCTLVDAITAANTDSAAGGCTAGSGADEIQLTVDVTLTQVASTDVDGDNGLPLVSSVITIEGNGRSILRDLGAPAFRIFNVTPAGELVLSNTTVGSGFVLSPGVGGGILNRGDATLVDSTLTANRAANGGGGYNAGYLYLLNSVISDNRAEEYDQFFAQSSGGGIMNVGSLEAIGSTISGNSAVASGYYSYATGGGIQDTGTLVLYGGTVSDNVADAVYVPTSSGNEAAESTTPLGLENWAAGGGIFASGTALITNVMISGNDSDYFGGGVSGEGSVTIMDSRLANNSARSGGGASARNGTLTLISSTIDGNDASSGGGLYTYFGGTVSVVNSTVSGNTALGRGGALKSYGSASLTNSTVTGNSGSDGGGIWSFDDTQLTATLIANSLTGGNCSGGVDDLGNNFADDGTCGTVPDTLTGLDPALADNGGPTPTHALLPGSIAIDAAGVCGLPTDQRGFSRSDGACDSGSFEFGAEPLPLLVVSGVCPGEVTIEVSTDVAGQSVVLFAGSSAGTFELPGGPCAGTELDMANARFVRELVTDGSGFASITREFRAGFCGRLLQAVDASCGTSNVAQFPE